jgi:hypothetical protein
VPPIAGLGCLWTEGLKIRGVPSDSLTVPGLTCPECGAPIQTLDLPCPSCPAEQESRPVVTQYSKTFEYKPKPFVYQPDVFAEQVNRWLAEQVGLINVTMTISFLLARIQTVTVNCTASNQAATPRVRIERVSLPAGFLGRNRLSPGEALNTWADRHPDRRRLNYWTPLARGVPIELWILYVEQQPAQEGAPSVVPSGDYP